MEAEEKIIALFNPLMRRFFRKEPGFNERVRLLFNYVLKNQFLRFCLVGGIATIVNYAVFLLFLLFFHINYLVSSAVGYVSGVFVGFDLNKKFTFKSESKEYYSEVMEYFAVYTISLFLGLGFLAFLVNLKLNVLLANVFSIALTTMTNFLGVKFFVFSDAVFHKKINFLIYRYRYLLNYMIIGLSSIIVEIAILYFLGLGYGDFYLKLPIGFLSGVLFSYYLNAKLNFKVPKEKNWRTFRIFLIISVFAFALNLLLMKVIYGLFIFSNYSVSRLFTSACIFMISYSLHRRFTFTDVKEVGVAIYLSDGEDLGEIKSKVKHYPDFIHLDLVDKTYAPSAAKVDLDMAEQVAREWPLLPKMLHVMSRHPIKWIESAHTQADYIVFHAESDEDPNKVISLCRRLGKKVGISVRVDTNLKEIEKYFSKVDLVQILGIRNPGYSNQHMEAEALEKLRELNQYRKRYPFEVCMDGGVKLTNIHLIDARYIVSASSVLKSSDSVKAIYDLKTSARYFYDYDKNFVKFIETEVKNAVERLDFIESGTFVGSFAEKPGLEGIADIDVVIIVDKLTRQKYGKLLAQFEELKEIIKTDFGYDPVVNPTFGPLKFNSSEKSVVLHVMIYDIAGHVEHCKESPFTCLDWQRSPRYFKKPMSYFCEVTCLKPNDFFNARRSVSDYLKDLKNSRISYREYEFNGTATKQVKKYVPMGNRDRFEFSYHIMKFCMLNFLKLYTKSNYWGSPEGIVDSYFDVFGVNAEQHKKFFFDLREFKLQNRFPNWSDKHEAGIYEFLKDFETQFKGYFYD